MKITASFFTVKSLEVPRLSGTADRLPLLVRQTQLPLLKEGRSPPGRGTAPLL